MTAESQNPRANAEANCEPDSSPFVSVIVPCRQEAEYIERCIRSILANDYPANRIEVLVVEGASDDGTRAILERLAADQSSIRVIDNPAGTTPAALNRGLAEARGEWIVRMDVHTEYPTDYIRRLIGLSQREGAENVGGVWQTLPGGKGAVARAIAHALGHPLGVGNAHFRIGVTKLTEVDTVPFGCYPRRVFDRLGGFDEELVRNQDDEFNHRLRLNGGRILLTPEVCSRYYARRTLLGLARMYYQYGLFKPLVWRKLATVPTWRPLLPAIWVLGLLLWPALAWSWPLFAWGGLLWVGAYAGVLVAAILTAWRVLGPRSSLALGVVLPVLHGSYGLGIWMGLVRFVLLRRRVTATTASRVKLSRDAGEAHD